MKEKEISKKNQAEKIEQTEKLIDQEENIENNQIQEGDETNSNRKNSQKLLAIPFGLILFYWLFLSIFKGYLNIFLKKSFCNSIFHFFWNNDGATI